MLNLTAPITSYTVQTLFHFSPRVKRLSFLFHSFHFLYKVRFDLVVKKPRDMYLIADISIYT